MTYRVLRAIFVAAAFVAGAPREVQALPILLTPAYEATLEGWLGQGNLNFTNIYEKQTGDTASNFHAAVDGLGATFTLMQAIYLGNTYVIGGYNPQSWNSSHSYNYTPTDAERTAFIYNLTTGVLQKQRLTSDPFPDTGLYQTWNEGRRNWGPAFGGGFDIGVSKNMIGGESLQYSYGAGGACGIGGENIFGAVTLGPGCSELPNAPRTFTVAALEVYTFAPSSVPDTAHAVGLFGLALLGLALGQRASVAHLTLKRNEDAIEARRTASGR